MEERYKLLAANNARNLADFNRKVENGADLKWPVDPLSAYERADHDGDPLPYYVIVIDELADLMMTVQGEVETPLAKLAQKARAIGIHLVLATQRPSVNVVTGLIKANFPSRIAFQVASQVDSRTIIDGVGAELLLGTGDMLFLPPGKPEPERLQGAFISSEETEALMHWYGGQPAGAAAVASETAAEDDPIEVAASGKQWSRGGDEYGEPGERDKLFREAAEVVIQHQQGSTSLLQRRLKVGYGRAARIIDQLHAPVCLARRTAPARATSSWALRNSSAFPPRASSQGARSGPRPVAFPLNGRLQLPRRRRSRARAIHNPSIAQRPRRHRRARRSAR
jgi:DNA segregation ATPase FtsK/SpoIIIE, S-DNA-T family